MSIRSIINCFILLLCPVICYTQTKPITIDVGLDIGKIGSSIALIQHTKHKYEIPISLLYNKRWLIFADLGYGFMKGEGRNYTNLEKGAYLRLGPGFLFPRKRVSWFVGTLVCSSFFENEINYDIQNFWGNYEGREKLKLQAMWMELVTGLRVPVGKHIIFSFTPRLRFFLPVERLSNQLDSESVNVPVTYIPGHGPLEFPLEFPLALNIAASYRFKLR